MSIHELVLENSHDATMLCNSGYSLLSNMDPVWTGSEVTLSVAPKQTQTLHEFSYEKKRIKGQDVLYEIKTITIFVVYFGPSIFCLMFPK